MITNSGTQYMKVNIISLLKLKPKFEYFKLKISIPKIKKFVVTLTSVGKSISNDPNPQPPKAPNGMEVILYKCSQMGIDNSLPEFAIEDHVQILYKK